LGRKDALIPFVLSKKQMKKFTQITLVILAVLALSYLLVATSVLFFPDKTTCMADKECLTQTHWQQMGGFEKFTPDGLRTGCWSTALAQIAYYHKLKPHGQAKYTTRQGYEINEDLNKTQFNFNVFTVSIDSTTSEESSIQLARYNYYAALAMQKDFGTDRYMNKLAPAELLETHYNFKVERFISWKNIAPYTNGKLEQIIYNEINQKRPVFLHFANLKDFGHSVVVDGYCYKEGNFQIHTNQGQGGPTDGWYDFHKGILRPDDNALRVIYTFEPY
jgi:hypothetical protein